MPDSAFNNAVQIPQTQQLPTSAGAAARLGSRTAPLNVIIIALGSAGDVHPFIGIGRTLRQRGHQVSVCCSPAFEGLVARCGLRFLPIGTLQEYQAAMNDPAMWDPRTSLRTLWRVIADNLKPLFDLLAREVDDNTVMLGSLWAFSARLLQERYGVPLLTAQVSPSTLLSAHSPPTHKRFTIPAAMPVAMKSALLWLIERSVLDRICGPDLNRFRSELGLPPVHRIMGHWMHSPQGVLGLFPEWYAPPQRDWPPQVRLTGFPLFDEAEFHSLDAELQDFLDNGTAPIVFTPGSTMIDGPAFFGAAGATLRSLGRRGIYLAKDLAQTGPLPADVCLRSYVPMSQLLPRSAALVHHGGVGSTALAFAAGIPQLATPFAHDQFDNAERIQRIGCGRRLDAPVNGSDLLRALQPMLQDPAMAQTCASIKARMPSSMQACDAAADAVEALAPLRRTAGVVRQNAGRVVTASPVGADAE